MGFMEASCRSFVLLPSSREILRGVFSLNQSNDQRIVNDRPVDLSVHDILLPRKCRGSSFVSSNFSIVEARFANLLLRFGLTSFLFQYFSIFLLLVPSRNVLLRILRYSM